MFEVFCGKCESYQGTEKVPNPKSTAWMDASRPKCAIDKSKDRQGYHCVDYKPNEDRNAK